MKNIILSDKLIFEENPKENTDKKGIIYFAISAIFFGLVQFHIKLTKILFDDSFDSNSFMLWRSLSTAAIAYLFIKYHSIKILRYSEINNKFWFLMRTFGNYFAIFFLAVSMTYLRAATASCINSMSPAVMLIFSVFILKERLEIRYIVGVIVCFLGAIIIILNERRILPQSNHLDNLDTIKEHNISDVIYGTFFGIISMVFSALMNISQKLLSEEKIEINNIIFYIGLANSICAIIFSLISSVFNADLKFGLFSSINSIFYQGSCYFLAVGLTNINLSKITPIYYLSTLTVFICGILILKEQLFFTDIIGSLIILSFNVYHSFVPIQNK